MAEDYVVEDLRVDADRMILTDTDTSRGPLFKVSEVSRIFFNRTSYWIRWLEEEHRFVIDGDRTCKHFEWIHREIDQLVDGKPTRKKVKSRHSWVKDGVCTHCGGRQVGVTKTRTGSRSYTLTDIEQMIHALAGNDTISGAQAALALLLVQTIAKIHGYLP